MTMEIPLFPLHTVLAPGIALPLHVFEDRYRLMIRHCLETGSPFGVVLIREGREVLGSDDAQRLALAAVGTLAEIREATELPDGRWTLLVVGGGRFALKDVIVGREPYLVGIAEPAEDPEGDPTRAEILVERVSRRFVQYLRLLQPREGEAVEPIDVQVEVEVEDDEAEEDAEGGELAGDRSELAAALHIPEDPSTLSFLLTGIVQVDVRQKQALLEAPSAEVRLDAIDALLDRELVLLGNRLAPFTLDQKLLAARAN
jgi:uncharacterized protein